MLDIFLIILLSLVLPAYQVWRGAMGRSARNQWQRLQNSALVALGLLTVLATTQIANHRSVTGLGLGLPESLAAQIGLAISIALSLLSSLTPKLRRTKLQESRVSEQIPATKARVATFIGLLLLADLAWEVLYRAYLINTLTPLFGSGLALVLSALAYSFAHGRQNLGQAIRRFMLGLFLGIAYVFMHNLWPLIVLRFTLGWLQMRSTLSAAVSVRQPSTH